MKKLIISQRRVISGTFILLVVLAVSGSCKKSTYDMTGTGPGTGGSGGPGLNEVFIQGMAFNPATITVSVGTTITWTNKDPNTHTVTSTIAPSAFDSGAISSNGIWTKTFTAPGTYNYACTIHPTMTARVIVN
jgi:plastocyanin